MAYNAAQFRLFEKAAEDVVALIEPPNRGHRVQMFPLHGQRVALPKQLSPAIHGRGLESRLELLADVLVHGFRAEDSCPHRAEVVADPGKVRDELQCQLPRSNGDFSTTTKIHDVNFSI